MQKWQRSKLFSDTMAGAAIHFQHFRTAGDANGKHSIPYATICSIDVTLNGKMVTISSIAAVEPGEKFSYKIGREISSGRARKAIASGLKLQVASKARPFIITTGEEWKRLIPVTTQTKLGPRFTLALVRENEMVETLLPA